MYFPCLKSFTIDLHMLTPLESECGILTKGGMCMEGPEFRNLTPKQLDAILPKLQVLARSSPKDKHSLVTRLNGNNLPQNEEEWLSVNPNRNWLLERGNSVLIYICNFHVLNHFLLIYICKLHWN